MENVEPSSEKGHYMLETPKADSSLLRNDTADGTMDNQQPTEREKRIAHAMLFVGEGSLMITRHFRRNFNRHTYRSLIQFTNTDTVLVEAFAGFLKEHSIAYFVHVDDRREKKHRVCYQVIITSLDGQRRWLEMIMPFLIGQKSFEAKFVLEYILSRITRNASPEGRQKTNPKTGRFVAFGRASVNEREIELFDKVRALHSGGSETTRAPLDLSMYPKDREDIVRLQ